MPILRFPSTLLEQVAFRLRALLLECDDPQREVRLVLRRLENADLFDGGVQLPCSIRQFIQVAIVDNEALRTSLSFQLREWRPTSCDDVQDLISNLLPSDGHLD